jgi:hypothetical protein
MGWTDLADLHGVTPDIKLPIHGETVHFPGRISAWAGSMLLTIRASALEHEGEDPDEVGEQVANEIDLSSGVATELERELLGDGEQALERLGATISERQHVVNTVMAWHLYGEESAREVWEAAGKPPARQNRAARRKTAGRSSTASGKGSASSRGGSGGKSASAKKASPSPRGTRGTRKS